MSNDEILKTEYSEQFDAMRKNSIIVGFHEYGPIKINYENDFIKAVSSMEKCIDLYKETGNQKYLIDLANFSMIEFMIPKHPNAHSNRNDSAKSATVKKSCYREITDRGVRYDD